MTTSTDAQLGKLLAEVQNLNKNFEEFKNANKEDLDDLEKRLRWLENKQWLLAGVGLAIAGLLGYGVISLTALTPQPTAAESHP